MRLPLSGSHERAGEREMLGSACMTHERRGIALPDARRGLRRPRPAARARASWSRDGGDLVVHVRAAHGRRACPTTRPHHSRSDDGGRTWTAEGPVWPSLVGRASISVALSRVAVGDAATSTGRSTRVDDGEDTWWDGERQALKQNDLIWARSSDAGRTWPDPTIIPMPIPGAAEAPGPMTVRARAAWSRLRALQHVRRVGRGRPQPDRAREERR